MKIDAKSLAKNDARIKKNAELTNEGHVMQREGEAMGEHIKAMMSLIESIHHKDPEAAHQHIVAYAKHAAAASPKDAPKEQ